MIRYVHMEWTGWVRYAARSWCHGASIRLVPLFFSPFVLWEYVVAYRGRTGRNRRTISLRWSRVR